jgi:hypothetical protein
LPEVVVLGSQNVGKSSVLKHIVGEDIFPADEGLCTRCPIVVQVNHITFFLSLETDISNYEAVYSIHLAYASKPKPPPFPGPSSTMNIFVDAELKRS